MIFKNLDNKTKAYGTLIVIVALAGLFWYYSDAFTAWTTTANPWLVLIVSIIINPAYIFLIYTLYKEYNVRGMLAGIFISVAIDVMSLPHSINKAGALPTDAALNGYSDTTFYKVLYNYIHGEIGSIIVYIVLIGIISYLALRIIRRTASFNKIVKQTI